MIEPSEIRHKLAADAEWFQKPVIAEHEPLDARLADRFDMPRSKASDIVQWVVVALDASETSSAQLFQQVHTFMADCLCSICRAEDSLVEATAWRMALGVRLTGSNHESVRRMAPQLGMTAGGLAKRIRLVQTEFNIPLGIFNKSAAARAVYARTNGRGRHSTNPNPGPSVEPLPEIKRMLGRAPDLFWRISNHVHTQLSGDWSRLLSGSKEMQRLATRLMQISKADRFEDFVAAMREHERRVEAGRAARRGKESIATSSLRGVATPEVYSRETP